jgi:protein-disulfide isomerase
LILAAGSSAAGPADVPAFDLTLAGAASKGRASAPLVMLEFSDFECPFCGRYSRETYHQVQREYVETGKVRYVFRHTPIERSHPQAMKAAEAAECGGAQKPNLVANAQTLGLNMTLFQQCLASGQHAPRIRADLAEGLRAGVTGTPAFFIGTVTKDGKLKVRRKLIGAKPFAMVKQTLDSLLAQP